MSQDGQNMSTLALYHKALLGTHNQLFQLCFMSLALLCCQMKSYGNGVYCGHNMHCQERTSWVVKTRVSGWQYICHPVLPPLSLKSRATPSNTSIQYYSVRRNGKC